MTLFRQSASTSEGGAYPVVLGRGASSELPTLLASTGVSRAVVITDSHLEALHAPAVARLAGEAVTSVDTLAFPAGEPSKTRATKEDLEDRMLRAGCGRDTAILALGGGVTGDLAGFTAATYMRGVPWIPLPTSLLAMADASVGGKTGVDHPMGKNLIGAFHPPIAVLADTSFLETLPDPEFISALAEVVKAGVVGDAGLFRTLERTAPELAACRREAVEGPLAAAVAVKIAVVSSDAREAGRRKTLNFGHTVGHALERWSGFSLSHGRAVSSGMAAEARMAAKLGLLDRREAGRIEALLERLGLSVRLPQGAKPAEILDSASTDKKALEGRLQMALPEAIGQMARPEGRWTVHVPEEVVLAALEELREGRPDP